MWVLGLTSIPSHHISCGHHHHLVGAKCEIGAMARNPFFQELLFTYYLLYITLYTCSWEKLIYLHTSNSFGSSHPVWHQTKRNKVCTRLFCINLEPFCRENWLGDMKGEMDLLHHARLPRRGRREQYRTVLTVPDSVGPMESWVVVSPSRKRRNYVEVKFDSRRLNESFLNYERS
jgi:hypothetical protein